MGSNEDDRARAAQDRQIEIAEAALRNDLDGAIQMAEEILDGSVPEDELSIYQWGICQNLIGKGESRFVEWFLARTARFLPLRHVTEREYPSRLLHFYTMACRYANLAVMQLLVDRYGIDPAAHVNHANLLGNSLDEAVLSESLDAVRWLLDRGVPVNLEYRGKTVCIALFKAAYDGFTDICRLLVERGCLLNSLNHLGISGLDLAEIGNHPETAEFLRSAGALPGWQIRGELPPGERPVVVNVTSDDHVATWPELVRSLREVQTDDDCPFGVFRYQTTDGSVLMVTSGVSDRVLRSPSGAVEDREFARVELMLVFAEDHCFAQEEYYFHMGEAETSLLAWFIRVARLPETGVWFGQATVVANDDPAGPLWPGCPYTSILVVTPRAETHHRWVRPDGEVVRFYTLMPLYEAEREYERIHGVDELLQRIAEAGIPMQWHDSRPCAVEPI